MLHVLLLFFFILVAFSPFIRTEKVEKSYFFSLFFVFSFDHNSQKTPTHLMMYQYSDSNLE
jgi:hypothetical protein